MSEFTGERVIPGQVEDDLWAEHIARYAWASRFAAGRRVLDVGCGTGYGTAELAKTASRATGVDSSTDAIGYATTHYPEAHYYAVSATDLPFADASFDLVTAFEIIEHLADWPRMLNEVRRVLAPDGLFLVSTPNKLYYAEARGEAGPNPFHAHEFEYEEFCHALRREFAHVRVMLQDRTEAFAFYEHNADAAARLEAAGAADSANFFIGICSQFPLPDVPAFVYVPKAANLLRERERHIALLEQELAQVRSWLNETAASRDTLLGEHTELRHHLDEQNQWARSLETNWQAEQARVVELQNQIQAEQARAAEIIAGLNEENRAKTQWALDTDARLSAEIAQLQSRIRDLQDALHAADELILDRTRWAQDLDAKLAALHKQLHLIGQSRWLKLGRLAGLGPKLGQE